MLMKMIDTVKMLPSTVPCKDSSNLSMNLGVCFCFGLVWFFECQFLDRISFSLGQSQTYYVANDNCELPLLQLLIPGCWDNKHVPPCLTYSVLGTETRTTTLPTELHPQAPKKSEFKQNHLLKRILPSPLVIEIVTHVVYKEYS